ncbi:hypothetical protein TWF102_006977 [Orbilia oligospora]|uniref:Uncharacterized protein n=1 Tax=Orbilia oligospora TaxID=2813651 RepID=A0A7C8JFV7_ORBOL|nr:hypothetical protein TWF103_005851 [Orbilia oligospora]KAF3111304.1 hypothetical protein TWF102_006977 [Orbilia oligospora]
MSKETRQDATPPSTGRKPIALRRTRHLQVRRIQPPRASKTISKPPKKQVLFKKKKRPQLQHSRLQHSRLQHSRLQHSRLQHSRHQTSPDSVIVVQSPAEPLRKTLPVIVVQSPARPTSELPQIREEIPEQPSITLDVRSENLQRIPKRVSRTTRSSILKRHGLEI